jgi:hypothetical protein
MADQALFLYGFMGYFAVHPLSQRFMTAEAKVVCASQQEIVYGGLVRIVTACALAIGNRFMLNCSFAQPTVKVIMAHQT